MTPREMTAEEVADTKRRAEKAGHDWPPETILWLCATVDALRARAEAAEADTAALSEAWSRVAIRAAHPDDRTPLGMLKLIQDASLSLLNPHPGTGYRAKVRAELLRELATQHRDAASMTESDARAGWHSAHAAHLDAQADREEQG